MLFRQFPDIRKGSAYEVLIAKIGRVDGGIGLEL